ncbi:DUF3857 domain-containing protein [Granulicella cerasi]|uniref:DUF3857 domain-containing protein n=1 Tax=Granulicella cerasi TaxID=741063 RepID=A0ABW1Z8F6_9BACT|nr:DUF3857 domain-containing protein [Granulicella cerasi]
MLRFYPVAAVALLSSSCLVLQAQSTPSAKLGGPVFSATVAELRAASAAAAVTPDWDAQILLEESRYRFAADGTRVTEHRRVFRIDAQEAVKGWSEISQEWDPWFEKPSQLRARVLTPDGRFIELDQKTITDAPVKADDSETFSSEHVRRAPLPAISVGTIVEEVETSEEKVPYFAPGGNYQFSVRLGIPVATSRLIVEAPVGKHIQVKLPADVKVSAASEDVAGIHRMTYEATALAATFNSDINLNSNESVRPHIFFSTGASWEAMAVGYAALSEPQIVLEDVKSALPASLPTERTAKIAAVLAALHKSVRYTGVEFGSAKLTPQRPAETLKRHYGDCKDKSTMLVAMLRAVGVPAHLALLSVEGGEDVQEDQPGLTQFDHAIVYVPAAGKEPAFWIDATAEYNALGNLPWSDHGRKALIIAPDTKALTLIPVAVPADSVLVESRDFELPQYGPSHVMEVSQTTGFIDAQYRSDYAGEDVGELHTQLERYANNTYLAKKLKRVSHGDAMNMQQPFALTLDMEKASRGLSGLTDSGAVAYANYATQRLPRWFRTKPEKLSPDASAEAKKDYTLATASRLKTYSFMPFRDERRVHVVAPEGFVARTLLPNKTTQLGKATLTEEYKSPQPNVIDAVLRFDSGPGTLTTEEALAMRSAVLELEKRDYIALFFDAPGERAKAAGDVKAELAAQRKMLTEHPAEALAHARLANTLMELGLVEESQAQARKAVELAPNEAICQVVLAYALERDSMGVRFGGSFDRPAALQAMKKAVELDPENDDFRFDLAVLYEFNARGIRYAKDADLASAVTTYRATIDKDKEKAAASTIDNMLYALYFAGRFQELNAELAKLPSNATRRSLAIASAVSEKGVRAGLESTARANDGTRERLQSLRSASSLLTQTTHYAEAAEVLNAGIEGDANAATLGRQVELYRHVKHVDAEPLKPSEPAYPVARLMTLMFRGNANRSDVEQLTSRDGYVSDREFSLDVDKSMYSADMIRIFARQSSMAPGVMADLIENNVTFKSTGDDATGWKVIVQISGSEPSHMFVAHEGYAYRVVCEDKDKVFCGNAVMKRIEHGDTKGAIAMLDWLRDLTHRGGGDDVLSGSLLPRFWTVGSTKEGANSTASMRLAAISLIASSVDAKPYLAEVSAAREKATGARQEDLDLLLAEAASGAEDAAVLRPAAERLLAAEPDSDTALRLYCRSYLLQNEGAELEKLLRARLEKKPDNIVLLRELSFALEHQKRWADACKVMQQITASDKAEARDWNGLAWLGVVSGNVTAADLKAAQQAVQLTKAPAFPELHTLACVYAMQGRVAEARDNVAKAMAAVNQTTPNSEVWLALGLIYEQYGEREAALGAYHHVVPNQFSLSTYMSPTAGYRLAQARIAALENAKS